MKKPLPNFLYYSCNLGMGIFGLLISYMLIVGFLASVGILPKSFDASIEVPVRLDNPIAYYQAKSLDAAYLPKEIEIKKASLEVVPVNRSWPQGIAYAHAAFYLTFYFAILFFLGKIFRSFSSESSFSPNNPSHLRKIGFVAIGLGLYEFLVMLLVASYFHNTFEVQHAETLAFPSFWDINLLAVFMGLIFLSLAEVFNQGWELQELESQTV